MLWYTWKRNNIWNFFLFRVPMNKVEVRRFALSNLKASWNAWNVAYVPVKYSIILKIYKRFAHTRIFGIWVMKGDVVPIVFRYRINSINYRFRKGHLSSNFYSNFYFQLSRPFVECHRKANRFIFSALEGFYSQENYQTTFRLSQMLNNTYAEIWCGICVCDCWTNSMNEWVRKACLVLSKLRIGKHWQHTHL